MLCLAVSLMIQKVWVEPAPDKHGDKVNPDNDAKDVSSRQKLAVSWVFCNEFVFGENGRVGQESSLRKCMCQLKCYQRSFFLGWL